MQSSGHQVRSAACASWFSGTEKNEADEGIVATTDLENKEIWERIDWSRAVIHGEYRTFDTRCRRLASAPGKW